MHAMIADKDTRVRWPCDVHCTDMKNMLLFYEHAIAMIEHLCHAGSCKSHVIDVIICRLRLITIYQIERDPVFVWPTFLKAESKKCSARYEYGKGLGRGASSHYT